MKIRNNELSVTGLMMPRFMYQDGQVYDANDLDAGLLEGHTFRAVSHVPFNWQSLIFCAGDEADLSRTVGGITGRWVQSR